eukprot:TRINITY_DN241_c0_g1_i2.p2 TRINITY_DN241_c0_g1~~TRINITY_DN241_c0_g1_i2.p2  ORF type:complete len:156 (-),score=49.23 TRINITY_DN241_c0_g1_i2:608-1012(-)
MLCISRPSIDTMTRIFESILGEFMIIGGFEKEVKAKARACVDSTIQMYLDISAELLPTPARSHYTFNLRDISKVVQGMMMVDSKVVSDKDGLVRLWIHESSRCFHDRLIDEDDRDWFKNKVAELVNFKFGCTWS